MHQVIDQKREKKPRDFFSFTITVAKKKTRALMKNQTAPARPPFCSHGRNLSILLMIFLQETKVVFPYQEKGVGQGQYFSSRDNGDNSLQQIPGETQSGRGGLVISRGPPNAIFMKLRKDARDWSGNRDSEIIRKK